ncbi:MAG: sialate O-acetylesterase [Fibrobacteres bacterium]|jgi:hypothetical protein|nr:sialate O-acetylesterase [Fibrobacterota bacterium]
MKTTSKHRSLALGLGLLAASLLAVKGFSQDPNFYIFLAFGQSNMEGYPGQQQHQDSVGLSSRFQTMPAVDWPDGSRKKGTWTPALPPLCRNSTGLCPCDYFGRTLTDSLPANIKIGIINVAVAGCAIEMFDPAKYQSYASGQASWLQDIVKLYGGSPYARLVEVAKLAQKDGVIKGIIMHQGESGSSTGNWNGEVKIVYNNLVKDLGLDSNKTPFLAGDFTNPNGQNSIVWGLPKVMKQAYAVSSKGDEANSTGIHFSAAGYRALGKSYADTMLIAMRKLGIGPTGLFASRSRSGAYTIRSLANTDAGTLLSFGIPERAFITLSAYTVGGRQIAQLARGEYAAGEHSISFGGEAMPAGAIVLKLNSGSNTTARTLVMSTAP